MSDKPVLPPLELVPLGQPVTCEHRASTILISHGPTLYCCYICHLERENESASLAHIAQVAELTKERDDARKEYEEYRKLAGEEFRLVAAKRDALQQRVDQLEKGLRDVRRHRENINRKAGRPFSATIAICDAALKETPDTSCESCEITPQGHAYDCPNAQE